MLDRIFRFFASGTFAFYGVAVWIKICQSTDPVSIIVSFICMEGFFGVAYLFFTGSEPYFKKEK